MVLKMKCSFRKYFTTLCKARGQFVSSQVIMTPKAAGHATLEFCYDYKIDKITMSKLVLLFSRLFEKMLIQQKQFVNFHITFQLVF